MVRKKIYPASSENSFYESNLSYFLPGALDLNADTGMMVVDFNAATVEMVFLTGLVADLNFLSGRAFGGIVAALLYTLWLSCLAGL